MEDAASPSGSQQGPDLHGRETVPAAAKLENTFFFIRLRRSLLENNSNNNVTPPQPKKKQQPFPRQLLSKVIGGKKRGKIHFS